MTGSRAQLKQDSLSRVYGEEKNQKAKVSDLYRMVCVKRRLEQESQGIFYPDLYTSHFFKGGEEMTLK